MTHAQDEQAKAKSLIPGDFLLDLNRSLTVPWDLALSAPWNLPSRMFRFPVEVSEQGPGGTRRFGLMHPKLGAHPFVKMVEAELGHALDPLGAPNSCGVSNQRTAEWWHAVDLISSGHWRDLLETKEFTTDDFIKDAVAYGLDYSSREGGGKWRGHINPIEARTIMEAVGSREPGDRRACFRRLAKPMSCRSESGKARWPINDGVERDPDSRAWARIFGVEAGWLTYDASGFLQWSARGRDAYEAGAKATFTEAATGQGAFAF